MKKLVYVLALSMSLIGFSQATSEANNFSYGVGSSGNKFMNSSEGTWVSSKVIDKGIVGSEYVYKFWQPKAMVTAIDGKQYAVSSVNFNARLNRFAANLSTQSGEMYKVSQDSVYLFNSSGILKVKIGSKEFVKASNKFYEVVFAKKDTRLLKLYKATVKEAPFNPMTQQKTGKDKMVVESSYFLEKAGVNEFKLKTKTVLALLNDKEAEVKKFIKANKLSVKNENHLTRIFNYYKSL